VTVDTHSAEAPAALLDERDLIGLMRAARIEIGDDRRAGILQFTNMFRGLLDQLAQVDAGEQVFDGGFDPRWVR
jgi:hypothetical protein